MKKQRFLQLAAALNRTLGVTPLLYGSLGLEQRLGQDLGADDVDVLVPGRLLEDDWPALCGVLSDLGYTLYDPHEHAFQRDGLSAAFAAIESLGPFAGVAVDAIPEMEEDGARYLLLGLEDYLKVYTASARDGYRRDKKLKDDGEKCRLIRAVLEK